MRVRGAVVSTGVSVEMFGCTASGSAATGDMAWSFGNFSNITSQNGTEVRTLVPGDGAEVLGGAGYCLDVSAPSAVGEAPQVGPVLAGSNLQLMPCAASRERQQFRLDSATGLMRTLASATMCVEARSAEFRVPLTCADPPLSGFTFCDRRASLGVRVDDMVRRATLAEQMLNMEQRAYYSHGIPRLGEAAFAFFTCSRVTAAADSPSANVARHSSHACWR